MISDWPQDDWAARTPLILPGGRVIFPFASFPKSGVYDTRTLKPIWQVDWYALPGELRWSDDFQHIVHVNFKGDKRLPAIAFFNSGRLIRQYAQADLFTSLRAERNRPFETWDWHFLWCDYDYGLDPTGRTLLLATPQRRLYWNGWRLSLGLQEHYAFDLATGQGKLKGTRFILKGLRPL